MAIKQSLREYRNDIDQIDSLIIHLLNERFEITEDIGYIKNSQKRISQILNMKPKFFFEKK